MHFVWNVLFCVIVFLLAPKLNWQRQPIYLEDNTRFRVMSNVTSYTKTFVMFTFTNFSLISLDCACRYQRYIVCVIFILYKNTRIEDFKIIFVFAFGCILKSGNVFVVYLLFWTTFELLNVYVFTLSLTRFAISALLKSTELCSTSWGKRSKISNVVFRHRLGFTVTYGHKLRFVLISYYETVSLQIRLIDWYWNKPLKHCKRNLPNTWSKSVFYGRMVLLRHKVKLSHRNHTSS